MNSEEGLDVVDEFYRGEIDSQDKEQPTPNMQAISLTENLRQTVKAIS